MAASTGVFLHIFKREIDEAPHTSTCSTSSESSSDVESRDDTMSVAEEASDIDLPEENDNWSCSYDSSIYSDGIAIQKVPNSDVTVLQWLALNFNLFTSHPSMSKTAFSDNLQLQNILKSTDCDSNSFTLPTSYSAARRMIEPYVVKKKIYLMCTNDCVAYRNEFKDLDICPLCKSDKKKRFVYLPIGPRIARLFGEQNLAKLVQAHPGSDMCTNDKMWDIHDAPVWKEVYSKDGYFSGHKNGLSFALELDGVNPFHNIGVQYSMTPIMLTLLNLPRHVRNAFGNIMLVGIVPGSGCSEAAKMDPYIEIMVDEMLYLSECSLVDQYQRAPVDVKIKVLLFVLDYPGLSKVFRQVGSGGLSGCHWCFVRGKHCSHLSKVIYLSNRAYLSEDDTIRKDETNFLEKQIDISKQPVARCTHTEKSVRQAYDSSHVKVNAAVIASATGYKGAYALEKLPAHDRLQETHPDACHTKKDVTQNIMNLLTKRNVDLKKIIAAEQAYGRLDLSQASRDREHSESSNNGETLTDRSKLKAKRKATDETTLSSASKKSKPEVLTLPYVLTVDEVKTADQRASSIRVPLGFGVKPSPFISKPGSLKSHDWKQIACHGILKYCLRGTLSQKCRETLFFLLDCISRLCNESQCIDDLSDIEADLNKALALLERDFPLSLQNITTHILHHVVDGIRRYGPVYGTWMYVFKRFNSWICKRALNMRYPEAIVMETFIVYDWCQFMISSGKMPSGVEAATPEECLTTESLLKTEKNFFLQITVTKRQLKSIHSVCYGCTKVNCSLTKHLYHTEKHPISCRIVKYSCLGRSSTRTQSCYVCFETNRGSPTEKVSSGQFVVFGEILYFLKHTDMSTGDEANIACINTYVHVCFDQESQLWYCSEGKSNKKSYVSAKNISCPLVTAVDEGVLWFLDSGKKPI